MLSPRVRPRVPGGAHPARRNILIDSRHRSSAAHESKSGFFNAASGFHVTEIELRSPSRKARVGGPYLDLEFPDFFRVETLAESGKWLE